MKRFAKPSFLFTLICSFGLWLGYAFSWLWPLGVISLAFFISTPSANRKAAAWRWWWFGFVYLALVYQWYFDTLPLSWAGLPASSWDSGIVALVLLLQSAVLALSFALVGWWLYSKNQLWFPLAWVVSEGLRHLLAALLYLGPTSFGLWWTYGDSGESLAFTPLINQLLTLGGVPALSLLFALLALLLALYIQKKPLADLTIFTLYYTLVAVVAGITLTLLIHSENKTSIHIIGTDYGFTSNYSPISLYEKRQKLNALLHSLPLNSVALLPEGANAFGENVSSPIFRAVVPPGATIIDTYTSRESVMTGSAQRGGESWGRVTKYALVPHGEYTPFLSGTMVKLFGSQPNVKMPRKSNALLNLGSYRAGLRFCNEITASSLYQEDTRSGASVLFTSASLAMFKSRFLIERYFARYTLIRGLENHRSLLVSTNDGQSLAFDSGSGRLERFAPGWGIDEARVSLSTYQTVFVRFRNLFLISFGILYWWFVIKKRAGIMRT